MQKYGDEENIKKRQAAIRASQLNIENTIMVEGVNYTFSERKLFEDLCSVQLPEEFVEMNAQAARLKYPSEFRPQVILTDKSGEINFTFSYLANEDTSNDTILQTLEDLRMASKRMHPSNVFGDIQLIKNDVLTIPYYSARSTAFDDDIYTVQFLASMEGHLLMGGFTCRYGEHDEWSLLLPQCFETIKDLSILADEKEGL